MEKLPGYDAWKTAGPDEPEREIRCCEYCAEKEDDVSGEYVTFEGETMCPKCFAVKTTICPQCKNRDFTDHIEPDGRCWCCHRDNAAKKERDERADWALDHEFNSPEEERVWIESERERISHMGRG